MQSQSQLAGPRILDSNSDSLKGVENQNSGLPMELMRKSVPVFPSPVQGGVDDSFYGDWDVQGMAQSMRKDGRDDESAHKILKQMSLIRFHTILLDQEQNFKSIEEEEEEKGGPQETA